MEITPLIKEDFIVLQDDTTLSEMIGKLKQFEKQSALVFRKNKYLGLIEKKRLLKSRVDATEVPISNYVQKTPLLSEHADVIETAYLMFQSNADYLPVERNKQIVGVLDGLAVVQLGSQLPETKSWRVKDIKLVKATVAPDDAIARAMEVMYTEHIDHVPVLEAQQLSGIISYKDILRKYLNWSPKRDVSAKFNKMASSRSVEVEFPHMASLPVSNFSTNDNLFTVPTGSSLKEAIVLMVTKKVNSLLVMEGAELAGLLTVKNILRRLGSLKIIPNYNISFIGLEKVGLESYQKYAVQKIASNEAFKLQRKIKNEFSLVVHLKAYGKDGKRQKYSVHLKVEFPGKIITCAQDDWNIETALHKTFTNALNKVKTQFRGDSSHRKPYE